MEPRTDGGEECGPRRGSGYVLLAFLRADLVDRLHWFTEAQLLDAIAVGQGHGRTKSLDGQRNDLPVCAAR